MEIPNYKVVYFYGLTILYISPTRVTSVNIGHSHFCLQTIIQKLSVSGDFQKPLEHIATKFVQPSLEKPSASYGSPLEGNLTPPSDSTSRLMASEEQSKHLFAHHLDYLVKKKI